MKRTYKYKMLVIGKNFRKIEANRLFCRAIFSELRFSSNVRFFFFLKLMNLYRHNNLTKLNYFCPDTNQKRGVLRFFNVFRMKFRENVSFGAYSGIRKSSW